MHDTAIASAEALRCKRELAAPLSDEETITLEKLKRLVQRKEKHMIVIKTKMAEEQKKLGRVKVANIKKRDTDEGKTQIRMAQERITGHSVRKASI